MSSAIKSDEEKMAEDKQASQEKTRHLYAELIRNWSNNYLWNENFTRYYADRDEREFNVLANGKPLSVYRNYYGRAV